MKRYILFIGFCLVSFSSFPQMAGNYKVETFGSAATGDHTPFWIVNHQWGMVALEANNFYVRGGFFHAQTINPDWSFDAGIDLAGGNAPAYGNAWIQQLYGRLNWKMLRLDVGAREEYNSFLHPYLSSGDFINSNNARPFPQVKVSLPHFFLLPYTQGNVFFKADFSVGKFLDGQWQENQALPHNQNYTQHVLSHNKSAYFRIGDIENKNKRQFIVGLIHATEWGGDLYKYNDSEGQYTIQHQPHGIGDLMRVALAQEGSAGSSGADLVHKAGAQWGAYLLRYDYKCKDESRLSVYMEHFFEDGSGMGFQNYRDNLLGVEFRSKDKSILSGVVFEYIYTKQQTGAVHHNNDMDDEHKDRLYKKGNGNDDYYNNTDYVQEPSYFGKSMGTPLFLSPEYNTDGSLNFKGSRILAFHLGLEGYFHPALQYRLLLTTGQNWGRFYVPFKTVHKGFVSQGELIYTCPQVPGLTVKLAAGYDKGEFFGGDTFGGGITIAKQGTVY